MEIIHLHLRLQLPGSVCLISPSQIHPQVVRKAQQRKATIINIMSDYGVQIWCASSTQKHFLTTWATRSQQGLMMYIYFLLFTINMLILKVHRCVSSVSLKWEHVFGPKAFFLYNLHGVYIWVSRMQLTLERNSHKSPGSRQNSLAMSGKSARVSVIQLMRVGFTGTSSSLEAMLTLFKVAHRSKHC